MIVVVVATVVVVLIAVGVAGGSPVVKNGEEENMRAISLAEGEPPVLMTQAEAFELRKEGVRFMDHTSRVDIYKRVWKQSNTTFPTAPSQQALVDPLLPLISSSVLFNTLTTLSTFHNRFYTATTGASSANWIFSTLVSYAGSRIDEDITVTKFAHAGYNQFSVIARIAGTADADANRVVVVGAHEDSVNWAQPDQNNNRAPGADDDGSGTVATMEIFRILAQHASYRPKITAEFHFYAAEEVGLYGSQDIAESYRAENIDMVGYYNLDMIAYAGGSNSTFVMQLFTDYVNAELSAFVAQLYPAYSSVAVVSGFCGYACSDHASWHQAGYPASFVLHQENYPYGHSQNDLMQYVNCLLLKEVAHTALAFIIEIAEFHGAK